MASDKLLPDGIAMFPVIDLAEDDDPIPATSAPSRLHIPGTTSGPQTLLWTCQFCAFAANLPSQDACSVCLTMHTGIVVVPSETRDHSEKDPLGQENPSVADVQSTGLLSPSLSSVSVRRPRPISGNTRNGRCVTCKSKIGYGKSKQTKKTRRFSMEPGLPSKTGIVDKFEGEDVEFVREIQEQEVMQQWMNIISDCRRDKTPFVDGRFPATPASLAVCTAPATFSTIQSWLRPSQLKYAVATGPPLSGPDGWTVCGIPSASDIKQGILGNCWFMSSLSAVAERPELIYNILVTREYNIEGAYLIRLCVDGLWRIILVDDLFPADAYARLSFSQASRQQLWVPLIEKALSKAYGSYCSISGGTVSEGFMVLTGAPCEHLNLDAATPDDYNSIWERLSSIHKSGFLIGASCGKVNLCVTCGKLTDSVKKKEYVSVGLLALHGYSLLNVADAGGNRLVQLRNPWGHQAWTGDWSDQSELWTVALRQQLKPSGAAEGLFWMCLADLVKYFRSVEVSKYREHWLEIRQLGNFPSCALHSQWYVWMISVKEETEVNFTLYQRGYRRASTEMKHHQLDLALLVFSVTPDGNIAELVAASPRIMSSAFVDTATLLLPGQYVCWTVAFNHFKDTVLPEETFPKSVLAVHSSKSVVIERLPAVKYALADAIISWTLSTGKSDYATLTGLDGLVSYYNGTGGFIVVLENRYPNHSVLVKCDFSQSRDMVSTRGALVTVDLLPPLSRCVVGVLSPTHSGHCQIRYFCSGKSVSGAGDDLGDWLPAGVAHAPPIDTDMLRDLHSPRPM